MLYPHDYIHPTHCFCQIPVEELQYWATKHFKEGQATIELLQSTKDPHEQEVIGIVALLEVDEETLLELMGNVELPEHHILHCREHIKGTLDLVSNTV